jgi:hypothetical protein
MTAWLRLAASIALAPVVPAGALQNEAQPALDHGRIVSAAQDCLDSYKGLKIDPKMARTGCAAAAGEAP